MNPRDETTPLLTDAHTNDTTQTSETRLFRIWARCDSFPTAVRVTPIIFLSSLYDGLPQLTIVDIMKRILCEVWYLKNDPGEIPDDGSPSEGKCQTPGPVAWFSAFIITQALLLAFGGFVMSSLIAQYGTRVGRKPILLLILMGQLVSMASFVAALFTPGNVGALVFLGLWLVMSSLCSNLPLLFTCNFMVVDTTDPSDRTAALSFTMGATIAGGIPSFAFGGLIYRLVGPRVLCLITLGISIFTFLLASSGFVQETFDGNKLAAARNERKERRHTDRERSLERWLSDEGDSTRGIRRVLRKTFEVIQAVFNPLAGLRPTIKEDGKWNLRLTWLGIAYFIATLGLGYITPALISYMTLVLHQDPAQSGVVMTALATFQTIGLVIIFPFVATRGRVLYTRLHSSGSRKQEPGKAHPIGGITEQQPSIGSLDDDDTMDNPVSELSTAHFDVYLLRWCYILFIILVASTGYTRTEAQMICLASLLLFCAGAHPALQSIAAASVSPIQAGEAIAGVEMVGQIARFTSPIVIGTLQSKTILTMPKLMFFVMAACVFVAAVLTLLIRDEDRYIAKAVVLPQEAEGSPDGQ